jgi:O-antigen/teichoic acid export membrane protein
MSILKKIVKSLKSFQNEMIYVGSDILIKAVAFVSMPFFLKVMTPADFGEFNLFVSYGNLFSVFLSLNVASAIVRYYFDSVPGKKYIATALWVVLINGLIVSGIIIMTHEFYGFFAVSRKYLIMILINCLFSCFFQVGCEYLRSEKKANLYGFASISHSFISISFGLVFVYGMQNFLGYWRFVALTLSSAIVGCVLIGRICYKDGISGNIKTAKYLLSFSIPLIPYALSTIVLVHINKLFLAEISYAEVGIFSFASNIAMLLYIISMALNRSLQPEVFEALRDKKDIRSAVKKSISFFLIIYVLLTLSIDILIFIFGNQQYIKATEIIPVMNYAFANTYLYTLYVNILYYYKKNGVISLFAIINGFISIFFNALLIYYFGLWGAAIASVLSYFSLFFFSALYVHKRLKFKLFSLKEICYLHILFLIPPFFRLAIM